MCKYVDVQIIVNPKLANTYNVAFTHHFKTKQALRNEEPA
jgi:hypothetical protein